MFEARRRRGEFGSASASGGRKWQAKSQDLNTALIFGPFYQEKDNENLNMLLGQHVHSTSENGQKHVVE